MLTEHSVAIAPATYDAAKTRAPSHRALHDGQVKTLIERVHRDNYGVYGAPKMHAAPRRDGVAIGRHRTGRLMHELGLAGVRRGRTKRTTVRDQACSGRRTSSTASSAPTDLIGSGCAT